ncbi:MAG: toll/interleukin-1 receptor domain-containing protein, partial [bacterium]|nr:toll/interleukin-1 receptor domain-containing protein [bacterium]
MNRIFISYAKEDGEVAQRLYQDLRESGLCPWLDTEDLTPGVRWKNTITKAIEECDYFVALLSSRSVSKRGYVQKEIRQALETLETVPEDQVFVVPVRLEECRPSHAILEDLHWLDLFPRYDRGFQRLLGVVGGRPAAPTSNVVEVQDVDSGGQTVVGHEEGKIGASIYRVLIVGANPVDTSRIRVEQEAREISSVLNGAT